MNLQTATIAARSILSAIAPYCERAEIAGSIRRLKPDDIKDIEIVGQPRSVDLFKLAAIVNRQWGEPVMGKFPSKYTKVRGAIAIDFFWASATTWGMVHFIRTGPDTFCQKALARWKSLTGGGYSEAAQLHLANHEIVPTPDEASVFRALQWDFIPPEKRL